MKYTLLIVFIALLMFSCKKEEVDTQPTYYLNSAAISITPNSCIETADGNLAFCGVGANTVFVTKVSKTGTLLWSSQYIIQGGTNSSTCSITEDANQNLYATTSYFNGIYLVKLTPAGDSVWTKSINTFSNEDPSVIITTTDGNLLIGGTIFSADFFLYKATQDGNFIWEQTYSQTFQQQVSDLTETGSGGYLITGANPAFENLVLIKTNTSGVEQWSTNSSVGGLQSAGNTLELADGSFVTCGSNVKNNSFQLFVFKADNAGNEVWQRSYGNVNIEAAKAIAQNADGSFAVTGTVQSQTTGRLDGFFMKVAPNGDSLQYKYFGSKTNIFPTMLFKQANGDNLIVGQKSDQSGIGSMFITRTDVNGTFK